MDKIINIFDKPFFYDNGIQTIFDAKSRMVLDVRAYGYFQFFEN